MLKINKVHHIAIICSDYEVSKHFYTKILGFEIIAEAYRSERDSYKLDLALNGNYSIELFHFPTRQAVFRVRKPADYGIWLLK